MAAERASPLMDVMLSSMNSLMIYCVALVVYSIEPTYS